MRPLLLAWVLAGCTNIPTSGTGIVSVLLTTTAQGVGTDIQASFGGSSPSSAAAEQLGPCQILRLPGGVGRPIPAGVVTLTDGGHTVMLHESVGYYEELMHDPAADWPPGSAIAVTSTGNWVPPFSVTTKMADLAFVQTLSQPLARETIGVPLVVAEDLTVTWTGASTGLVELELDACTHPGGGEAVGCSAEVRVICDFDAAGGSGTIPSSVLTAFPVGVAGTLFGRTVERASVETGGFDVEALAGQMLGEAGTPNPFDREFVAQ